MAGSPSTSVKAGWHCRQRTVCLMINSRRCGFSCRNLAIGSELKDRSHGEATQTRRQAYDLLVCLRMLASESKTGSPQTHGVQVRRWSRTISAHPKKRCGRAHSSAILLARWIKRTMGYRNVPYNVRRARLSPHIVQKQFLTGVFTHENELSRSVTSNWEKTTEVSLSTSAKAVSRLRPRWSSSTITCPVYGFNFQTSAIG